MKTAIIRFEKYLKRRYPDRSTAKHYLSDLKIFHQFVGKKRPREITVKTIDAFIQAQQAEGLKASTINRRLSSLASFFDFLSLEAEADDWLNPVRWKQHRVQQGRHLPRDVKDETAEALLALIDDHRDRAIFSLMLKGGLRVGEVVALDLAHLEAPLQNNLARLRVYGKGQKERIVWLTQDSWLVVQGWLDVRPASQEPALFLNQHGHRLSVSGVQYRLKQYTQRTGERLSCHQLRHTYARRLAQRDMPLDSLAKLMGHSSLQTTQLYIDGADPVVRRDFEQAMQKLSQDESALPQPLPALSGSKAAILPPSRADERPDGRAILQELAYLTDNLPPWLQQAIEAHMLRRMPRWAAHHLRNHSYTHLNVLRRICQWLVQQRNWTKLAHLQRVDLLAYVDYRLDNEVKASSINAELTVFHGFWRELIEREQVINGAILQVKAPAEASRLPRYLKPEQFQRLQETLHTQTAQDRPQDRFERAWFYLLAHAGLRISEALNLRLDDCDLTQRRLRIQAGKGDRDRVVPMTATLAGVLAAYLLVREATSADHLLIYRGTEVKATLVSAHLRRLGKKADVEPVSPHRLRHTLATLLVNQGMPITSLQKFLGHQDINTTLIYARVFDETVRHQFAAAMAQIEAIAVAQWPTASITISTTHICDSV
jgi:site-specific recombinase XerD